MCAIHNSHYQCLGRSLSLKDKRNDMSYRVPIRLWIRHLHINKLICNTISTFDAKMIHFETLRSKVTLNNRATNWYILYVACVGEAVPLSIISMPPIRWQLLLGQLFAWSLFFPSSVHTFNGSVKGEYTHYKAGFLFWCPSEKRERRLQFSGCHQRANTAYFGLGCLRWTQLGCWPGLYYAVFCQSRPIAWRHGCL